MDEHPWSWAGSVAWVVITAFFIINLMVAVIRESLIELQNTNEQKRRNKAFKDQKKLINNQTEYLLDETRKVLQLQEEMMAKRLAMQGILLDIATASRVASTDPSASPLQSQKGMLQSMLAEAKSDDEDGDDFERKVGSSIRTKMRNQVGVPPVHGEGENSSSRSLGSGLFKRKPNPRSHKHESM